MDGWINMDVVFKGWMDGWMEGWMDGWMDVFKGLDVVYIP